MISYGPSFVPDVSGMRGWEYNLGGLLCGIERHVEALHAAGRNDSRRMPAYSSRAAYVRVRCDSGTIAKVNKPDDISSQATLRPR
jgi:hypothetical protein